MLRNRGFTMVELLAATALSTLLFIVALSVIRTLRPIDSKAGDASQDWKLAVRQQLEWDLRNAVVLRQDEHGLMLAGYGSMNDDGSHLPVLVVYSLHTINARQWLMREQTSLDPLVTDLNSTQLLCGDVKSFSYTGSYAARTVSSDSATPPQDDPTPILFQQIAGAQRLPDRVRVRIDLQNDPNPVMNQILYLR